nr:MAG TPA: hypothetical protein [Caudoviricetes sp.]
MIKIKFNGATAMNDVSFARINNHVVELGGITDAPITGFTTWRMDGVTQLGDFGGYTTVYRVLDNAVQLSDDGSIYVEPEVPEPVEPQPTQEEKEKTLMKAQIKALSERNDFLEDCMAEMASIVYA